MSTFIQGIYKWLSYQASFVPPFWNRCPILIHSRSLLTLTFCSRFIAIPEYGNTVWCFPLSIVLLLNSIPYLYLSITLSFSPSLSFFFLPLYMYIPCHSWINTLSCSPVEICSTLNAAKVHKETYNTPKHITFPPSVKKNAQKMFQFCFTFFFSLPQMFRGFHLWIFSGSSRIT